MGYEWIGYAILGGLAIFVLWVFAKNIKSDAARSVEYDKFAQQNNYSYADTRNFETLDLPEKAWFCSRGATAKIENILEWKEQGIQFTVFRYFYHNNRMKMSWGETVLCLKHPKFRVPWFRSWPWPEREESWWHKGWKKICPDRPHPFFQNNVVKSKEKETVETLFTGKVLDQLAQFERTIIEGLDNYLILIPENMLEPGHTFNKTVSNAKSLMNSLIAN